MVSYSTRFSRHNGRSYNRHRGNTRSHESAVVGGLIGTINNPKTSKGGAERARAELKHEYHISHPPKRKWTTDLKRFLHIGTGHRHSGTHAIRRY